MKRLVSRIIVVALALGSLAAFGVTTASAKVIPTVVLGGGAVPFLTDAANITATASVPGFVSFTAIDLAIPGCGAVATTVVAPFIASCRWTPIAEGSASLGATLTPTDATNFTTAIAVPRIVKIGAPTQGTLSPITIFVDTQLATPPAGMPKLALLGACALTGNFMLGHQIIFRAYANDATRGGEALTPLNTASATLTIAGIATPIPLRYSNSGGAGRAWWSAALQTGTAPGQYNTIGVIPFTVTFIAKDSNSVKVLSTRLVALKKDGKRVVDENGRTVYERVAFYKTVSQFPALKGATGTFASNMFPASSQVTLHPVPTS